MFLSYCMSNGKLLFLVNRHFADGKIEKWKFRLKCWLQSGLVVSFSEFRKTFLFKPQKSFGSSLWILIFSKILAKNSRKCLNGQKFNSTPKCCSKSGFCCEFLANFERILFSVTYVIPLNSIISKILRENSTKPLWASII